ncbi:MAG: hypothetical protein JWM17_2154, partial [Actinobacteria bacterium]|nr:hypothetical protein [Actinomycetota bacterium]
MCLIAKAPQVKEGRLLISDVAPTRLSRDKKRWASCDQPGGSALSSSRSLRGRLLER